MALWAYLMAEWTFYKFWTIHLLICCHINLDEVHEKLQMGSIFESSSMKWSFLGVCNSKLKSLWLPLPICSKTVSRCLSKWFNDTHYLIYVLLLPPNVIWTCIVEWSWMWSGGETKPSVMLVPCWCQLLSSLVAPLLALRLFSSGNKKRIKIYLKLLLSWIRI